MKLIQLVRTIPALFLSFAVAASALAGEPTEQIRQTTDKIIAIVTDPTLDAPAKAEERRKSIRAAADERFAWREMTRRTLAQHWRRRTEEEKKEFVSLYSRLLERTYMEKIEGYSGEEVRYTGERAEDSYAVVTAEIVTTKDVEIPVEYRLKKKEGDWLIYDVAIEHVSLVNNYRTQFNSIILRSSYEELVERLKAKLGED
jgi:phospholipid transport system substrate-binding protein